MVVWVSESPPVALPTHGRMKSELRVEAVLGSRVSSHGLCGHGRLQPRSCFCSLLSETEDNEFPFPMLPCVSTLSWDGEWEVCRTPLLFLNCWCSLARGLELPGTVPCFCSYTGRMGSGCRPYCIHRYSVCCCDGLSFACVVLDSPPDWLRRCSF